MNDTVIELWKLYYGELLPKPRELKLFERTDGPPTSIALTDEGFYYSNREGLSLGKWHRISYSVLYGDISANVVTFEPFFTVIDKEVVSTSIDPINVTLHLFCTVSTSQVLI